MENFATLVLSVLLFACGNPSPCLAEPARPRPTIMNNQQLWQSVLAELQLSLSASRFSLFFSKTFISGYKKLAEKNAFVEIAVPHAYARDTIQALYLKRIQKSMDRITGRHHQTKLVIKSLPVKVAGETGPLFQSSRALEEEKEQLFQNALVKAGLRNDFSFENFAVSPTNEVAYAAATAVAKSPGKTYNPLFLYGGVGVGKTHLMQALAQEVVRKQPALPLVFCTAEEFTNEIIEAIRNKKTSFFKQRYRSSRLFLIDDVQFISGKTTVQEEFFHTFNAVLSNGGQVILTSDLPPHEITLLENRLRSRFEGGLIIDIQEPNFELRTAILLIKSQQMKISLPMDVAQLIAGNISSTRKLEGFLSRLAAETRLRQEAISLEMTQSLFGSPIDPPIEARPVVRPKEIIEAVARHFNIKSHEIKGNVRVRSILVPRQLAMYLLRQELNLPYEEIGRLFGGKDHSTVMHAVRKMGLLFGSNEELRLELSSVRKKLYG